MGVEKYTLLTHKTPHPTEGDTDSRGKPMPITKLKLKRLAIAFITVIIIADVLPHPGLGPGAIARTLSRLAQVLSHESALPAAAREP